MRSLGNAAVTRKVIAFLGVIALLGASPAPAQTAPPQPAPEKAKAAVAPLGRRVEYKRAEGRALSLYILDPPADHTAHSAIVFFHGGAWTGGEVSQFNRQSAYLAKRGMTAIQVEYRLLSRDGTDPPRVCAEDAKSAFRWVRAHAAELHIAPDRIVGAGGSAGGFLAAFATTVAGWDDPADNLAVSPRADALVLFNPVLDGGPNGFGSARFGDTYRNFSPFYHVDSGMPPTLIQSGDADKLVSPASLRDFQAAATAAHVRCELLFYPGQPHSFFTPEPYTTESLAVAAKFLDSLHLLLPGPAPVAPL